MPKLIKCVTENFSTEEELTEVHLLLPPAPAPPQSTTILHPCPSPHQVSEFFSQHPEVGCDRTIRQAKENISLNLYWKNRDLDSVTRFLESHVV